MAVVLAVVSCQKDVDNLDVNMGGDVATISVALPADAITRAGGVNSAQSGLANTTTEIVRVILQVYDAEGRASDERLVNYLENGEKTTNFNLRLVPERNYTFVAWADQVKSKDDVDNHYITKDANGKSDLNNITLNSEWNAMDETRDAFTGKIFVENFNNAKSIPILELKRPFAKLRVVTTDLKNITNLDITPAYVKVEYQTPYRASFNAYTSEAYAAVETNKKSHTFEIAEYDDNDENNMVLFTDYFFAEDDVVKFNMSVYEDEQMTKRIGKEISFNTDIYAKRNHLTTIKGNILTDNNGFTVTIDDKFNGETEYKVEDIKSGFSLQQAINDARDGVNTVITLGADINDGTFPITVPENKVITVKLNGKKITAPEESTDKHKYAFDIKGALTLEGEGEVKARGIFNYGTLTLESGTINACDGNGGYGVRNYGGATFTMNGGSIITSYEDGDIPGEGYDASPLRVDEGATATINGGTINNVSNYTVAIDNYGTTTIKGGTFTTIHTTIANSATMIIDGGSFTCNGLEGITAHALWAADGTTTINGGTFNGKDNYNGFNVCASAGAVVNIYGGEFNHVHSGSLYGAGSINVMGGFYYDDPTARVANGYLTIKINDTLYTVMKGSVENGVNTYVIENTMDLSAFSSIVDKGATFKDAVVKLTEDITLPEENWNPIGDNRTDTAFSGTFDGQNHTISGAKITGDSCFNGAVYGSKEGWGLFSVLDGATVKNVKLDDEVFASYTVISGAVAGYANNTTFENIDITNTKIAGYNWYTGGVVGWAAGNCTFKDINLDSSVVVGTLWDSHGQNAGGIAGGVSGDGTYIIEDCNIACVMDVINDVTSNYKWWIYRVSGMIIGNTNTTETKYSEVVTATATNVTCKNVTVTYGDWMNYHYCEGYWNRGWGRYESSDYVGGVDQNEPHNHADGESHYVCVPFDQLFGGSSNGSGHYPVRGLREFDGVTVNYPASYVRGVSNYAELEKAITTGISHIALESDITVEEWVMFSEDRTIGNGDIITIDEINLTIDGNGHTLTINDVESAGNGGYLFQGASVLNISNLTIKYADGLTTGGLGMVSGVIKDVDFIGGGYAILPGDGEIKVENCTFATKQHAIYFEEERDNLTVTGCTFNQATYAIILRGDVKFTDNIINNGNVTVRSGSPVITGNNFYNNRFKVYGAATATISNNTINNLVFDGSTYASTFTNNTLSTEAQAALAAATKVN